MKQFQVDLLVTMTVRAKEAELANRIAQCIVETALPNETTIHVRSVRPKED